MIDLSILVCGVHTRYDTFLPKIQKQLYDQYAGLAVADQDRVEIIVLTDNKKQMLGTKRNVMVNMAQGKYVQFVDGARLYCHATRGYQVQCRLYSIPGRG
jgi:hypothetical protein